MSLLTAVLRSAVLLTFAHATLRGARSSVCDAGVLAGAMTHGKLSRSQDLWGLCSSQFSQGVCVAAGQKLMAQLTSKKPASIEQFANSACNALEAAASQQNALLQRARPVAEDAKLSAIRSSPSAHRLSLDVARRYRQNAGGDDSAHAGESYQAESGEMENLDNVLHHKSLPFPHGTFGWEKNHSIAESAGLEALVEKWKKEHREEIDTARPDVVARSDFYKRFTTWDKDYDVRSVEPSQKIDVSYEAIPPKKADGSVEMIARKSDGSAVQMLDLNSEARNHRVTIIDRRDNKEATYKKSFLASGRELKELLSQATDKGNVETVLKALKH